MSRTFYFSTFLLVSCWKTLYGQVAATDPLVGVFANAEMQLELTVQKTGKTYNGFFVFQGKSYPYKDGVKLLGVVLAKYEYNGDLIPFTLSSLEDEFHVLSEGVLFPMVKKPGNLEAAKEENAVDTAKSNSDVKVPAAIGTRYKDTEGAYSFQLPADCTANPTLEGFEIDCGNDGLMMSISKNHYSDIEALKKEWIDVDDAQTGTSLRVNISDYGKNGVLARYTGKISNSPAVLEIIHLVSPHGGGVAVTTKAPPEASTPAISGILKSIANSIRFSKPVVSAESQQWITKLKGKQLLYLYTGNGYSEKYSYDLCVNNTFVLAGDNVHTSTDYNSNTSLAYASSGNGTWKIDSHSGGAVLILTHNDGQIKSIPITARKASNEVGLNGDRFFIRESKSCQ
jgi:hypothetical protein